MSCIRNIASLCNLKFVWNCVLWDDRNTWCQGTSHQHHLKYSPIIPNLQKYREAQPDLLPYCSHLPAMPLTPALCAGISVPEVLAPSVPAAFCTKLYSRTCQKLPSEVSRVQSKDFKGLVVSCGHSISCQKYILFFNSYLP